MIGFPRPPQGQPTVLLVDDEYLVRGVLSEILKESGFAVVAVPGALEAMAALGKPGHIDLVFSDVKMEPMDGFELARWIHENRPGLPVILASGYGDKTHMASDLHGVEFFRKPFDFDGVIDKIRDTIAQARLRSA